MIEIHCWDGSIAEADTPENALFAARILWDEALFRSIPAGVRTGYPLVSFWVDGQCVRSTGDRTQLEEVR